jgi:flagellar basal body-associated protein FliL
MAHWPSEFNMAEEVAEAATKKKGGNKMMIIIVAIMMLVTGGFVGLKMKGGGSSAKPEPKLGGPDNIMEIHEFLVNLAGSNDGGKFLRTDISVQTTDGFKKEEMDKYDAPIEDAINEVLTKYSVEELKQPNFIAKLRHEIAKAGNDAIAKAQDKEPDKPESGPPKHPEWDSQTGPILKVYLTTFAFQ